MRSGRLQLLRRKKQIVRVHARHHSDADDGSICADCGSGGAENYPIKLRRKSH